MAREFHARLSISILYTSSFILEPNKCLSPVGVSAHKSATTSVCGGGVRVDGEEEGGEVRRRGGFTLTCKDEKWQWVIAVRGTRSSGVDGSAIMADKLDNIIPFPSVWAAHSWRGSMAPLFSFLHCSPQHSTRSSSSKYWRVWGDLFVTGKHLTSTS